jgi:hypothetical protein
MNRELVAFLVVFSSGAAAHAADSTEGRWSVSLQGGIDLEVSGEVAGTAQGAIAGLATTIDGLSWGTAYGRSFRGSLSVGRRVAPRVEVFVRGSRYAMDGRTVVAGRASGLDATARLGRYQEWTAEVGARYLLASGRRWEPYVGLAAGARFSSAVPLTLAVPDAGLEASELAFLDKSAAAAFGVDGGVGRRLTGHLGLQVQIGLRYQGGPAPIDSGLQGSGLEAMNDGVSRWSVPVSAAITLRF